MSTEAFGSVYKFDKSLVRPFDLDEAMTGWCSVVNREGDPVQILLYLEDAQVNSQVVFKFAHLDLYGRVRTWHVSTATVEGQCSGGNKIFLYDDMITIETSKEQKIW